MAATIVFLLLAALMARVASAGVYAGSYAGGSVGTGNFGFNNPTFINPIKLPQLPGLPSPPPLPWPSNFPFPNFPQVPNFPQPQFPNLQPITGQNGASQGPRPGSSVILTSLHSVVRGEDGKLDKTGGSTLWLNNNNGEVTVQKTGDAPPDIRYIQYKIPSFADFQQPELKQQNFKRSFATMEPFSFEPIKIKSIKDIRPGSNEQFQGQSFTYSRYSNEVNGEKDSGGEASFITNKNGDVKQKKITF